MISAIGTLNFYFVAYKMLPAMKFFLNGLEWALSFCWFFLGFLAGVALDFLWWKSGISKYEDRIEVFEHYHWGLMLLIFMKILLKFNGAFLFLAGTGIALIFAEIIQDHPFAFKSDHQLASSMIGITLLILVVFI